MSGRFEQGPANQSYGGKEIHIKLIIRDFNGFKVLRIQIIYPARASSRSTLSNIGECEGLMQRQRVHVRRGKSKGGERLSVCDTCLWPLSLFLSAMDLSGP